MDVKTLCLGVLSLGDASGYEIRKMFEEGPFAHFHRASYGSIYPALSKLLDEELVSCTVETQDGRPDKKVYSLTKAGLDQFRTSMTKTPDPDQVRSETMFMLFFADHIDDAHLQDIYDTYTEQFRFYSEMLAGLDDTGLSRGRLLVRGFGRAYYAGMLKYLEEHRDAFLSAEKGTGWRDLESLRDCFDTADDSPLEKQVRGTK